MCADSGELHLFIKGDNWKQYGLIHNVEHSTHLSSLPGSVNLAKLFTFSGPGFAHF